jgi:hypothetical protein
LIASYAAEADKFRYLNETVILMGTKVGCLEDTVKVLARIAGADVRIRQYRRTSM